MDINVLSSLLQQFIKESGKVEVPGFGSFILKEIPSELLEDGKTVMPPKKVIVFESTYSNDGLLESAYSKMCGASIEKCTREINSLSIQMKKELMSGYKLNIPHFGILYFNEGYEFSFRTDESLSYLVDDLGLEPIILKKENDFFVFDTDAIDANVNSISDISVSDVENINLDITSDTTDHISDATTDSMQDAATSDILSDSISEANSDNDNIKNEEAVDDNNKHQFENKKIEDEAIQSEQNVKEQKNINEQNFGMESNVETTSRNESSKHESSSKLNFSKNIGNNYHVEDDIKEKYKRSLLILMWIVIVFIILAILVYIFQEPLRPFLEKILYTKEELETIMFFRQ